MARVVHPGAWSLRETSDTEPETAQLGGESRSRVGQESGETSADRSERGNESRSSVGQGALKPLEPLIQKREQVESGPRIL